MRKFSERGLLTCMDEWIFILRSIKLISDERFEIQKYKAWFCYDLHATITKGLNETIFLFIENKNHTHIFLL